MTTIQAEPQQLAALARARAVRTRRARLRRRLAAGEVDLVALLESPPWWAEGMTIERALQATPGLGPVKVPKVLMRARVSPLVRLDSLTHGQRAGILADIRQHYPAVWARIGGER